MLDAILLGLLFIGVFVTLLTPFSVPGIILTLVSFVGYLFVVGPESWFPIVLLALGLLLIFLEIFIPDFGLLGILGIGVFLFGLYITSGNWGEALMDFVIALVFAAAVAFFLFKMGYTTNRFDRFVLKNDSPDNQQAQQVEVNPLAQIAIGSIGLTMTTLRPSGKARFDWVDEAGNIQHFETDVISSGDLIEAGQPVEVTAIVGNKITVRSADL